MVATEARRAIVPRWPISYAHGRKAVSGGWPVEPLLTGLDLARGRGMAAHPVGGLILMHCEIAPSRAI
jgi:hypothetical protein